MPTCIQVYLSSVCYAQGPVNGSKTAYTVYQCPEGTCNLRGKARIKNTIVQRTSVSLVMLTKEQKRKKPMTVTRIGQAD